MPTRNRSKLLVRAVQSFFRQTLDPTAFEVIVVLNDCSDSSRDEMVALARTHGHLIIVEEPIAGLHNARHAGMRRARSDVLVYADDDIVAEPSWLASMAETFADEAVGLATGPIHPDFERPPPPWVDRLWIRASSGRAIPQFSVLELGNRHLDVPSQFVWGCNYAVRRTLLERVGGFHPDGMPDEHLLYRGDGENAPAARIEQLGQRCVYNPNATVHHWVSDQRMTFEYLYRHAYRNGITASFSSIRDSGEAGLNARWRALLWKRRIRVALTPGTGTDRQLAGLSERGFREGFLAHRSAVKANPSLSSWVHQPDYLEATPLH